MSHVNLSLSDRYNVNHPKDGAKHVRKHLTDYLKDDVHAHSLLFAAERIRMKLDNMHLTTQERVDIESLIMPVLGVDHL